MMQRMGDLAIKVSQALGSVVPDPDPPAPEPHGKLYRVQVGAYSKRENAEKKLRQISAAGVDCFITDLQDGYYRVQCGAYFVKGNAEAKMNALRHMGFDAIIKEYNM